jgi:hypothetical protein
MDASSQLISQQPLPGVQPASRIRSGTEAAAGSGGSDRLCFGVNQARRSPCGQLGSLWVTAFADKFSVDKYQRQAFRAGSGEKFSDVDILSKRGGLLGQIEAIDTVPLPAEPFEV